MKLPVHSPSDYGGALRAMLPPGDAWRFPAGGFADALLTATGQELARVGAGAQAVLDEAIELHRPAAQGWTLAHYRSAAVAALARVSETMPRQAFAVGSHVGQRLWSHAAPGEAFPVALCQVDAIRPLRADSRVGDGCWSHRARVVLRVRYYRSVVDPAALYAALAAFKQAHVYLWFEDITGRGGSYAPN